MRHNCTRMPFPACKTVDAAAHVLSFLSYTEIFLFIMTASVVLVKTFVEGIAGLVFTTPSPPVAVTWITAQTAVLNGRGRTAHQ